MVANPTPRHAPLNLRAYRQAHALASDVFWLTRRFPAQERYEQTHQLRQTSLALRTHIVKAWTLRYSAPVYHFHLHAVLRMGTVLLNEIDTAHACAYLTGTEYLSLCTRVQSLKRQVRQLQKQRISILAGGMPEDLAA